MTDWEHKVQQIAAGMHYPPTPNIAAAIRSQQRSRPPARHTIPRLGWAFALLLLIFAILFAVPQTRAALLRIVRLGSVTLFVEQPPTDVVADLPPLAGETTLAMLGGQTDLVLRRPAKLPLPDKVYYQASTAGELVIFVWLNDAGHAWLSFYQMAGGEILFKSVPAIDQTVVNGDIALWVDAPHPLRLAGGDDLRERLVSGNVLLFFGGRSANSELTYRLEGDLSQAALIEIAESLIILDE